MAIPHHDTPQLKSERLPQIDHARCSNLNFRCTCTIFCDTLLYLYCCHFPSDTFECCSKLGCSREKSSKRSRSKEALLVKEPVQRTQNLGAGLARGLAQKESIFARQTPTPPRRTPTTLGSLQGDRHCIVSRGGVCRRASAYHTNPTRPSRYTFGWIRRSAVPECALGRDMTGSPSSVHSTPRQPRSVSPVSPETKKMSGVTTPSSVVKEMLSDDDRWVKAETKGARRARAPTALAPPTSAARPPARMIFVVVVI